MAKCIQPTYMKDFQCNGKFCDCRCCRDWKIVVDDDAYQKFFELDEISRAEIFNCIDVSKSDDGTEVHTFKLLDDGKCSCLDDDGLCRIQKKHGENFLAAICRSFPRVTYQLSDELFQRAMTLTCPIAANLILLSMDAIEFYEVDYQPEKTTIPFERKILSDVENFLAEQQRAMKILQDTNFTINQRLKNLYAFFGGVIDETEFNPEEHATKIIDVFSKIYQRELNKKRKNELHKIIINQRAQVLKSVRNRFALVLENFLVNQYLVLGYPDAFNGDKIFNFKIFVVSYRVLEFALMLSTIAKQNLSLSEVITLVISISENLNHNREGMNALMDFANSCDEKIFVQSMLVD